VDLDALSRRRFLRLGGAALATTAVGGLAGCARTAADFAAAAAAPVRPSSIESVIAGAPTNSNAQIVDTGHGTNERFLRPLADNGVKTIFRYFAQENNLPGKNITPRERDMIFDHGMSIAIVYQWQAYRPGRFNSQTGRDDARFCMLRAREINQPDGSAVYFAVDNDSHPREDVVEYLAAVKRQLDGRYQIGCYGSGYQCAGGIDAGHATLSWIAEAPAWQGTRSFLNSRRWTIYQNKTQIESSSIMSAGGVPIDTDILNPRFDSIGAFDRWGNIVRYDPAQTQLTYDRRMFVTADQFNVRERARSNGHVVGHLCVARTVHVLSISDGWAQVDTNEDGRPDGYVSAEYLRPLHQMPEYVRGCVPEGL
jgi:hypothetical protein